IAELLQERLSIVLFDGVDDLAGFLEHVLSQRGKILLPIPGAPIRCQESSHQLDERRKGLPALLFERHWIRYVERISHGAPVLEHRSGCRQAAVAHRTSVTQNRYRSPESQRMVTTFPP